MQDGNSHLVRSGVQDYQVFDTASQNEALINEFKGNLFEYLVGLELAKSIQAEAAYLSSIDSELIMRLRSYEDWLWQNDDELAEQLPQLAKSCSCYLLENYQSNFKRVLLVGKIAGGSHDESVGEADLLLIDDEEKSTSISLKLCRKGAYVNTKSAGIRSFLSKYFESVPDINLAQERLSLVLDHSFKELARELHSRHDLCPSDKFSDDWLEAELPVLPGALEPYDQDLLYQHYFRVIQVINETLTEAFKKWPKQFNQSLASVLGFNDSSLLQLTCYHHEVDKKKYQLSYCELVNYDQRKEQLDQATFIAPQVKQASMTIRYPFGNLQIRVKPMNKFTVSALKINCSVLSHR